MVLFSHTDHCCFLQAVMQVYFCNLIIHTADLLCSPLVFFVEKGTSPKLTEPDWDAILAICDFVRSGDVK